MTPAEMHYLTCQNENCERFACVARRDYENQITFLRNQLKEFKSRVVYFDETSHFGPEEWKAAEKLLNKKGTPEDAP